MFKIIKKQQNIGWEKLKKNTKYGVGKIKKKHKIKSGWVGFKG